MKSFAIQLEPDTQLDNVLKPVFAVKRNQSGKIVQGMVVGKTQAQNEALILISNPGAFKNSPTLGVGLGNALLGDTSDMLRYRHGVRRCYDLDGLDIKELDMYDLKNINIKAKYR